MATVAEHVPFNDLCTLCEKISQKSGKNKLTVLSHFIDYWRDFHNKLHKENSLTMDSFFSAMRLLLPQCERERAAYGIKEVTLAKLYISIFCLDKKSSDAQKLLNYRSPKVPKSDGGDFASVAYFILKTRCPEKGTLKISDINQHLDNISTSHASKDKNEVKKSLEYLLRNTSALEQKWLIRMILKDMKLGISENSALKTYHIDGIELYNVSNSLKKVCLQLRDPSIHLNEIQISLFTPFRPMLCDQVMPQDVEKHMKNQPFLIEVKYDGERIQLHKQGNLFKYFSRNAHDVSETYGSSPLEGRLTPHIIKGFKSNVLNCILDGEMVIYSNTQKCIVSKGENAEVQAQQPEGGYCFCFCVFDMILINDKVLSNMPLSERVQHLKDNLTPIEGRFQLTAQSEASTNSDVAAALNNAIDQREEGIVIKNPLSIYHPNVRKSSGWIKVKPDYIDNLMDELDLLILGGYFGEGRRSNKISHFLLGICEAPDICPQKFLTISRIGSGYTDEELDRLLIKMAPHWEVFDSRKPPQHIIFGIGRKERPTVWIDPSKSHILQVRAAEIVRSDKFSANYTLRFPRVQQIRYDKAWDQCMTLQEFEMMRKQAEGKLARPYEILSNDEQSPKKIRRTQVERVVTVAPMYRPANISGIEKISQILKDKEICVMAKSLESKSQLERTIVKYGGKFVQNPGPETFCVLADVISLKVKNVIKTNQFDVVKDTWLIKSVEKNMLLPWIPEDLHHSTHATQSKLRMNYDEFGDGYQKDTTQEELRTVFQNISTNVWEGKHLDPHEIADIEFSYFSQTSTYGLFHPYRVYVDDKIDIDDPVTVNAQFRLLLLILKLKLFGATVASTIDDQTTHVVVHSRDKKHLMELKKASQSRLHGQFHIVTERWVQRCINHKNILQEKEFFPISNE